MYLELYRGCLINMQTVCNHRVWGNKQNVCTAQHDDQVVWHMPHGCWDRNRTVSQRMNNIKIHITCQYKSAYLSKTFIYFSAMLCFHIILYVPVSRYKFKTCNISCNEAVIYRLKHIILLPGSDAILFGTWHHHKRL